MKTTFISISPSVIVGCAKDHARRFLSRQRGSDACAQALSLAVLLTATVACAAPGDTHAVQAMLQASSPGSAATCTLDPQGNTLCTLDGTQIDAGDDCTSNMVFGAVTADQGVTLEDNFKPSAGKPVAHLGVNQLLCLRAAQRKGGVLVRALVMAIPTRTVKLCKDNELCKDADSTIEWKRPTTGILCTLEPDGHYTGDCASGWVDGNDIEEYSMGLKPEDTGA
ncbi:hypothetical protein IAE35_12765 [Pseudomonas sp. S75]|uniref:hypothetical protein n=1 Tax=unclassified Pseudomonas TaxID=196821 RepID=UPI001907A497|nr:MULTISPECIES: hypothetical protein [unclassified Pseudomonas]MBJ9974478.1 hypothetical protein [Pseudomonas sp. S30]MBK0154213.1 hypothetical protein [Pseudomonas sp. S75]